MSVAKAFSRGQAPQLNKSRLVRFVPSFYFSFNASKANDYLHSFTFKYNSRNKLLFYLFDTWQWVQSERWSTCGHAESVCPIEFRLHRALISGGLKMVVQLPLQLFPVDVSTVSISEHTDGMV